jgi:hypothetical protein
MGLCSACCVGEGDDTATVKMEKGCTCTVRLVREGRDGTDETLP